jgi:predicted SAM-dependent methyltransferase
MIPPLVALGMPTYGKVSMMWANARAHLAFPLGSCAVDITIGDRGNFEEISAARNIIVKDAIEKKAEYVFFLGDDVIVPPNTVLQLLSREKDIITGIYWTKNWPTHPYLWQGLQKGPYLDWKAGELFKVDFAGCDCLLVNMRVFKEVKFPWFSRDWLWDKGQDKPSELATEDFYFYLKAQKAGFDLWADTSIQCLHEDRASRMTFGLTEDMPQAGGQPNENYKGKRIADLGSGRHTPFFNQEAEIVRFDIDESVNPDFRCDLRQIPQPDESFDVVHSQHVLEHFGRHDAQKLIHEWIRILKVGGEIIVRVPNLMFAMKNLIEGKSSHYEWWQIYGAQQSEYDFHKNGFTTGTLKKLLEIESCLDDIEVVEKNENIEAKAVKKKSQTLPILTEWWNETHNVPPDSDKEKSAGEKVENADSAFSS